MVHIYGWWGMMKVRWVIDQKRDYESFSHPQWNPEDLDILLKNYCQYLHFSIRNLWTRDPRTVVTVKFFVAGCRDIRTAELVRIFKVRCWDPRIAESVRILKRGLRDPRTAESVRIFKRGCRVPTVGVHGLPNQFEFSKGDAGIHRLPNHSEFLKGDLGSIQLGSTDCRISPNF